MWEKSIYGNQKIKNQKSKVKNPKISWLNPWSIQAAVATQSRSLSLSNYPCLSGMITTSQRTGTELSICIFTCHWELTNQDLEPTQTILIQKYLYGSGFLPTTTRRSNVYIAPFLDSIAASGTKFEIFSASGRGPCRLTIS